MRYRITFEQVMSVWYVTVKYWEPDGAGFWKSVGYYQIPVTEQHPVDLGPMLERLAMQIG